MNIRAWLALIALILTVASFVISGYPLIAVSVILLAIALLVGERLP